jgi:hypothetical protein
VHYKTKVFGRTVPLMQMSYLGSLKAWVYAPIWAVWPPSAASVRLPMILCGAATVALTFLLMWELAGPAAAWIAAGLLAVDPAFVWTTRCDWGPVALQHVLTMGGVLALYRRRFGAGGLLFGLALWHKATFLWTLAGLGVALMAFRLWRHVQRRGPVVAALILLAGFAVGAYPVLRFNVSTRGRTAEQTARWDSSDFGGKWFQLRSVMDGASLYGYTVPQRRAELPGPYETGFSWVAGAAAVLVVLQQNRVGLFFLLTASVAWLAMAVTYGAGGSAHHVVLLWPWPQCVVAAAAVAGDWQGQGWRWWRWFRWAAVAAVAALELAVTVQHYRLVRVAGSDPPWSDAVFALHERLVRERPAGVVAIDWGIIEPLRVLSAGRLRLEAAWDRKPSTPVVAEGGGGDWLFVGHVDGKEAFAGANERFIARWAPAASSGRSAKTVAVVNDRQGRPVFVVYRLVGGAAGVGPI